MCCNVDSWLIECHTGICKVENIAADLTNFDKTIGTKWCPMEDLVVKVIICVLFKSVYCQWSHCINSFRENVKFIIYWPVSSLTCLNLYVGSYIFNLVGQFITDPALQDQCCDILSMLLSAFQISSTKDDVNVLGEQLQVSFCALIASVDTVSPIFFVTFGFFWLCSFWSLNWSFAVLRMRRERVPVLHHPRFYLCSSN